MADLRATWQGRALEAAQSRMMPVVTSMLAHAFEIEAMAVLLRVVKPKCWDDFNQTLIAPFFCSCGKVNKLGQIYADTILYDGAVKLPKVVFTSERDFEYELRKLADRLKFSDKERTEFFACAKRWIVADFRLDPTMDPADPDAKRLVLH